MSRVARKLVFGIPDHFRHKPGCIATEDGQRLEILDLSSRAIVLTYLCIPRQNFWFGSLFLRILVSVSVLFSPSMSLDDI